MDMGPKERRLLIASYYALCRYPPKEPHEISIAGVTHTCLHDPSCRVGLEAFVKQ